MVTSKVGFVNKRFLAATGLATLMAASITGCAQSPVVDLEALHEQAEARFSELKESSAGQGMFSAGSDAGDEDDGGMALTFGSIMSVSSVDIACFGDGDVDVTLYTRLADGGVKATGADAIHCDGVDRAIDINEEASEVQVIPTAASGQGRYIVFNINGVPAS